MFLFQFHETIAVFEGSRGVVYRTWSNDYEETVVGICAGDDCDRLIPALDDGFLGFCGLGDFVLEEIGGSQGIVTSDCFLVSAQNCFRFKKAEGRDREIYFANPRYHPCCPRSCFRGRKSTC